ncbi:MAG: hypothetical protein ACFFCM_12590, partial [Promethearchaeota archaeon]
MAEDFDIRGPIEAIQEKLIKKYYKCKETCDIYVAKTKMEEKRLKSIKTMPSVDKPLKKDIELKTNYIPYFHLEGNYSIEYLRRNKYTLPSDPKVKAIIIP